MRYGLALDCIFRECEAFKTMTRFDEAIRRVRGLGVETIEIEVHRRYEYTDETWERKLALLSSEAGLTVTLHHGDPKISSLDNDVRLESVSGVCSGIERTTRFLQAELIVLHPGGPVADEAERERRYERLGESTREILDACAEHDVKVAYENMRFQYPLPDYPGLVRLVGERELERLVREEPMRAFPRVGSSTPRLLEFVRSFDTDALGVCIDTGHANISEGRALPERIRLCADKLHHVHTSDNFGINDDHLPPGMADIDWHATYAALEDIGYGGTVLLEIIPRSGGASGVAVEDVLRLVERDVAHFRARGRAPLPLRTEEEALAERLKRQGPT